MTNIETVRIADLSQTTRDFFDGFHARNPLPEGDPGLAIYARDGGFAFVGDAIVPTGKGGLFRKTAPDVLYRGGACGFIRLQEGVLVVSDERGGGLGKGWFKPFPAGLSNRDEGTDLRKTFRREFDEEVWVFDHLERTVHYVPPGGKPKLECKSLGVSVKETIEIGQLHELPTFANETEKILECHMVWDISEWDIAFFSVVYDEDWFLGGAVGIPPILLDWDGEVLGWFAGQQGFVEGLDWNIHPAVQNFLDMASQQLDEAANG